MISFHKYLLSIYPVSGSVLGAEDKIVEKKKKFLPTWDITLLVERETIKSNIL